ncbi:MAG: hypothetical protein AAF518_18435 [Spirochaetota bacterium]
MQNKTIYLSAFLSLSLHALLGVLFYLNRDYQEEVLLEVAIVPDKKPKPKVLPQGFVDSYTPPQLSMKSKMPSGPQYKTLHTKDKKPPQKQKKFNGDYQYNSQEYKKLLGLLEKTSELRKKFKKVLPKKEQLFRKDVRKSYIKRKHDYEDIVTKEVLPTLETIDKKFLDILEESQQALKKHNKRNQIIRDFRTWDSGMTEDDVLQVELTYDNDKGNSGPLSFPIGSRKVYFDETLTLDKELQLSRFIKNYMSYDPNVGDLPHAIRELYYQNLQRLAYYYSYDYTYFMLDYFQESLNKEDYLRNFMDLARKLRGSKAAIEILFTIHDIYYIQEKSVDFVLQFLREYPRFSAEKKQALRIETMHLMAEKYRPLLKQKKIASKDDSFRLYNAKRLEIINHLLQTTPDNYRKKDAMLQKGMLLWERGLKLHQEADLAEAIRIWNEIASISSESLFYYERTYKEIRNILTVLPESHILSDMISQKQISEILEDRFSEHFVSKQKREYELLWTN